MKKVAAFVIVACVVLVFLVLPGLERKGVKIGSASVNKPAEIKAEAQSQNNQTTLTRGEIIAIDLITIGGCEDLEHCSAHLVVKNSETIEGLKFGNLCQIDYPGALQVVGEDGDRVLIRYLIKGKQASNFCPNGTLDFVDRYTLIQNKEVNEEKQSQEEREAAASVEQEKNDREAVKRILAESNR